ncbi:MAG: GNAT family N-acetyltransferase [Phycisphaerales bacterium]
MNSSDGHIPSITLRDVQPRDLDAFFAYQNDPQACAMAMVKPRTREVFQTVWEKVFQERQNRDSGIVAKAILADDELCGSIGCHRRGELLAAGYMVGRPFWGRGIASRALTLFLVEVTRRPLHAWAAASNLASLRILQKNGFAVLDCKPSAETERFVACDEVHLVLEA